MKKLLLLCTVGLMFTAADVGKAANVSQNEKTVIVIDDASDALSLIQELTAHEGVLILVTNDVKYFSLGAPKVYAPVFLAPIPVELEDNRCYSFVPYKQKGQLKAKFHPEYNFHPLKLC